jgi:uncharacterized protein YndB with AHSA1/START domain
MSSLTLTATPEVRVGMLIRRLPYDVYEAFADPRMTTRFWFTDSTGELKPGAHVDWEWSMHGAHTTIRVLEAEPYKRLVFTWNDAAPRTVTFDFLPYQKDSTYVRVTETGFADRGESGDEAFAAVTDSTAGFVSVLCAAKAFLEHDIVLAVVADHQPPGLDEG